MTFGKNKIDEFYNNGKLSCDDIQAKMFNNEFILAKSESNANGNNSVFFELNGQPRTIDISNKEFTKKITKKVKAEDNNLNHVGSPLPGQIAKIYVKPGNKVIKGDKLLIIEAMKMETIVTSDKSGIIKNILVQSSDNVESKDLLIEII